MRPRGAAAAPWKMRNVLSRLHLTFLLLPLVAALALPAPAPVVAHADVIEARQPASAADYGSGVLVDGGGYGAAVPHRQIVRGPDASSGAAPRGGAGLVPPARGAIGRVSASSVDRAFLSYSLALLHSRINTPAAWGNPPPFPVS